MFFLFKEVPLINFISGMIEKFSVVLIAYKQVMQTNYVNFVNKFCNLCSDWLVTIDTICFK